MWCFAHKIVTYYGKVHPDVSCSRDVVEDWLEDQRVLTTFQFFLSFQPKKNGIPVGASFASLVLGEIPQVSCKTETAF